MPMESTAYRDMINSRPYTGLQMIHMEYEEAYDFAGSYGMNAIITPRVPPYTMELVRLGQNGKNELVIIQSPNCFKVGTVLDRKYDIYWIGCK